MPCRQHCQVLCIRGGDHVLACATSVWAAKRWVGKLSDVAPTPFQPFFVCFRPGKLWGRLDQVPGPLLQALWREGDVDGRRVQVPRTSSPPEQHHYSRGTRICEQWVLGLPGGRENREGSVHWTPCLWWRGLCKMMWKASARWPRGPRSRRGELEKGCLHTASWASTYPSISVLLSQAMHRTISGSASVTGLWRTISAGLMGTRWWATGTDLVLSLGRGNWCSWWEEWCWGQSPRVTRWVLG